jgi:hypothetical protein
LEDPANQPSIKIELKTAILGKSCQLANEFLMTTFWRLPGQPQISKNYQFNKIKFLFLII